MSTKYYLIILFVIAQYYLFLISSIMNTEGERKMTAYLIHSLPLLMSAVQIFTGDKMAVVAHLVGLEQIGYETELGMNHNVSRIIMTM